MYFGGSVVLKVRMNVLVWRLIIMLPSCTVLLKVTKLTKIALIALRKKFTTAAAAAAAAANFFPKRYKGRRRCPLLLLLPRLLGVGRLAAATVRLYVN